MLAEQHVTRNDRVSAGDEMVSLSDSSSSDTDRPARIGRYIELISDDLRAISLDIHDHPELRYKERHAHHLLTEYLKKQDGWEVTPSAYGIDTAFVAISPAGDANGPVVSFNAEYDALPGIGHACGHNLIATVSLAASLATARIIHEDKLRGRVVLFGTPAEEGGGGKIRLLDAGAYRDHKVDISLISHPSISPDAALIKTAAYVQYTVEYFGKEAHAAARPWDGINALDALIAAINSVSMLRQQTRPGDVIQYRISNGGAKPNIIHAYAAGIFVIRAPTLERLHALETRFRACLDGAATATGATLGVKKGGGYLNHIPNRTLGRCYRTHFNRLHGEIGDPDIEELTAGTQASTDQGNISHAVPSLSPEFWIRSEDHTGGQLGGPHTPDFERAARSVEAHGLALRVAKALAATAVDVVATPGLVDEVKREFEDLKGDMHP